MAILLKTSSAYSNKYQIHLAKTNMDETELNKIIEYQALLDMKEHGLSRNNLTDLEWTLKKYRVALKLLSIKNTKDDKEGLK